MGLLGVFGVSKGFGGGAPRGGLGVSDRTLGDVPILVETPREAKIIPAGLRAPQIPGISETLPESGFDRFEAPRSWWRLEAS